MLYLSLPLLVGAIARFKSGEKWLNRYQSHRFFKLIATLWVVTALPPIVWGICMLVLGFPSMTGSVWIDAYVAVPLTLLVVWGLGKLTVWSWHQFTEFR